MKALSPVRRTVMSDQLNSDVIRVSSPVRLTVGGRAIFIEQARNHQAVRVGEVSCVPCMAMSVRVWVRS